MRSETELQLLARFLSQQRAHVLSTIEGLSDDQLGARLLPSGWSFAEMLSHLTLGVEHYWFRCIVNGEPFDVLPPGGDSDWRAAESLGPAEIVAGYRAAAEVTDGVVASMGLDDAPRQRDPAWPTTVRFATNREIVLHVIAESACHAGHLDAARELLDRRQWLVMG
jgi:uncharacterized damage-inducible protein DinB